MKIKLTSWNVNGIRACEKKGFSKWLKRERPHILCLQETKAQRNQLDDSLANIAPYSSYFFDGEKKGYSGTALYVHPEIKTHKVTLGLGIDDFDREARSITLEWNDYVVMNGYYPNGQRDLNRVPFKLDFSYAVLETALSYRQKGKKVILCGDFNTAHHPIDLTNPKQNKETTGFLPEERAFLDELLAQGFVDIFRRFHPDQPEHYTWWTYRNECRERNIGWRIDYFFMDESIASQAIKCEHRAHVLGSDHCPVTLQLKVDREEGEESEING
ncbi:MAG: exodeoxyribonuclease III [Bacteriovoracales bacterium]|nr:exodeoxyribonuclease III [Bacteriovoracales bacterium]